MAGEMTGGSLISTETLATRLTDPGLRIADASWYLPQAGRNPRAEYEAAHIPGAVFFDIDAISDHETDLPHMLPSPVVFATTGCDQAPEEDALVSLCAPASVAEREQVPVVAQPTANIALAIPVGTPIRIALDQRTRVDHSGELVHGTVVETVYAFDQPVIPTGTVATGSPPSAANAKRASRATCSAVPSYPSASRRAGTVAPAGTFTVSRQLRSAVTASISRCTSASASGSRSEWSGSSTRRPASRPSAPGR